MQKIWVDRFLCWQKCTVMLHESALSFLRHCRKLSQSTIAAMSPMQLLKRLSPPGQDSRTLRIKPDRGYTCNQWQRIVYHALSHDPCPLWVQRSYVTYTIGVYHLPGLDSEFSCRNRMGRVEPALDISVKQAWMCRLRQSCHFNQVDAFRSSPRSR